VASRLFVVSLLFLLGYGHALAGQQSSCPDATDERMAVEGGAPIVTLNLKRIDGRMRPARLVFDSGGGAMILDEGLANDLGLQPTGEPITDGGVRFVPTVPPVAQFGSTVVVLSSSKTFIHMGKSSFDTRERVEGMLPGKALEPYQVVLDYPKQRFTIAPSGCVRHRGEHVPSPFLPASGHPGITVTVDGAKYGLLLDTGSRATLAGRDLLERLSAAHPSWPHSIGASGTADMPGSDGREFLLRVPELVWGNFHIRNVLFVSRPDATYSPDHFETPEPIMGALGGNVLKNFRIEIDYPHGQTYLEQSADDAGSDMNSAGLVLDVDAAHNLVVQAVSTTAPALTKRRIRPGDEILEIDGKRESPWTIIDASNALAGAVGERKQLVIRRGGKTLSTSVAVATLL
jgi:hypothetical protein